MKAYYDPRRDEHAPFPPRNRRRRQSALWIAIEALAGGFVIALLIVSVKGLFGL